MKNIKTLSCSITNLNFSEEHGDKMCLIDIEAMKYITFPWTIANIILLSWIFSDIHML